MGKHSHKCPDKTCEKVWWHEDRKGGQKIPSAKWQEMHSCPACGTKETFKYQDSEDQPEPSPIDWNEHYAWMKMMETRLEKDKEELGFLNFFLGPGEDDEDSGVTI